jgi:hypothetical protein
VLVIDTDTADDRLVQIATRLPASTVTELDRLARANRWSRANVVALAVELLLERADVPPALTTKDSAA